MQSEYRRVKYYAIEKLGEMGENAASAVPALIELLKTEDSNTRQQIVGVLGKIGTSAIIPLIAALEDENIYVQAKAIKSLGQIKDPRAIEPLIGKLRKGKGIIAKTTIEALVKIGEPAVPPLINALKSESNSLKTGVAKILGQIGDPRAVEGLIGILEDEKNQVRIAAINALGEIGQPSAIESLMGRFTDQDGYARECAAEAIAKIGEPALEPLINALGDNRRAVRTDAIRALGELKSKKAVKPLLSYFNKATDDFDKKRIIRALCKIKDPETSEFLIKMLQFPNHKIQTTVLKALDEMKVIEDVDIIIALLENKSGHMRSEAARMLGEMEERKAVEPLLSMLDDPVDSVPSNAAWALGKIGDLRAVMPLLELLMDKKERVRTSAEEALTQIGSPCVNILIMALEEEDELVRLHVAKVLGNIKDHAAVTPLTAMLHDEKAPVVKAAIDALGEIKDPWVVKHLTRMLKYGIPMKSALQTVIDRKGSRRSTGLLLWPLSTYYEKIEVQCKAAMALGQMGDAGVPPLIDALGVTQEQLNRAILKALTKIGRPAVGPLRELSEHRNPTIRKNVEAALNQLKYY